MKLIEIFEDCSQEGSTDQIDAIDENTHYLHDEDHDMEGKDEEELDGNKFQLEVHIILKRIIKNGINQHFYFRRIHHHLI